MQAAVEAVNSTLESMSGKDADESYTQGLWEAALLSPRLLLTPGTKFPSQGVLGDPIHKPSFPSAPVQFSVYYKSRAHTCLISDSQPASSKDAHAHWITPSTPASCHLGPQ